jgi:polar amino acid transport system permease protein
MWDWSFLAQREFGALLVDGLAVTIFIATLSAAWSLILGILVAHARAAPSFVPRSFGFAYAEVFRNIPALFWILFCYFVLPDLLPDSVGAPANSSHFFNYLAAVLGLSLNNSAHISDIVLSGIKNIRKVEFETALALGLCPIGRLRHIFIPLVIKNVSPALENRFAHNTKNTALCMAISVPEIAWSTQQIESITFRGIETVTLGAAAYILLTFTLTSIFSTVANRLARPTRALRVTEGSADAAELGN